MRVEESNAHFSITPLRRLVPQTMWEEQVPHEDLVEFRIRRYTRARITAADDWPTLSFMFAALRARYLEGVWQPTSAAQAATLAALQVRGVLVHAVEKRCRKGGGASFQWLISGVGCLEGAGFDRTAVSAEPSPGLAHSPSRLPLSMLRTSGCVHIRRDRPRHSMERLLSGRYDLKVGN